VRGVGAEVKVRIERLGREEKERKKEHEKEEENKKTE